ncbi:MAG: ribonuclease HI [Actinomycetota bacterium]|nr:ribonuclease HI [Actinomycetota bacterium]
MSDLTCERCGTSFAVPDDVRSRYPGWTPRYCRSCHREVSGAPGGQARGDMPRRAVEENLTLAEVLSRYSGGPDSGVFTDGSANPNPGPGGWGAVYVVGGEVVAQDHGHDPDTTNNRMELTAVIRGCDLVPPATQATVYTDSRLVHDTITKWAAGWERRGWTRKAGEVSNLDLVKEAYRRFQERPELRIEWIPAHAGNRWNEYADSLSTAYTREQL